MPPFHTQDVQAATVSPTLPRKLNADLLRDCHVSYTLMQAAWLGGHLKTMEDLQVLLCSPEFKILSPTQFSGHQGPLRMLPYGTWLPSVAWQTVAYVRVILHDWPHLSADRDPCWPSTVFSGISPHCCPLLRNQTEESFIYLGISRTWQRGQDVINEGSINVYLSRWMNVTGTQYMFLGGWIDDRRGVQ